MPKWNLLGGLSKDSGASPAMLTHSCTGSSLRLLQNIRENWSPFQSSGFTFAFPVPSQSQPPVACCRPLEHHPPVVLLTHPGCPQPAPALPDKENAFAPWHLLQNYNSECEAAINNQVAFELHASYIYMSMASYFNRGDVALKHFSLFFLQQSYKEREHVEYLLGLQNPGASNPRWWNMPRPEEENWENGLRVLECALQLAKKVPQSLLSLHQLATKKHSRICNFLECDYFHEQVVFIQELGDHITNLQKLGAPEDSLTESL
ncbi:ferritin heavy chain-like [Phyllostomus hastatus]|uniref:ferritin heavy chain-like n=1 Tax=Phyllostomus hastatus TaxID=9423 RepID=UPI001E680425|nr:ferritin heavy chain-like [Phyllostomus hastatus]